MSECANEVAVYSDGRESPQYVRPLGEAVRKEGHRRAPKFLIQHTP